MPERMMLHLMWALLNLSGFFVVSCPNPKEPATESMIVSECANASFYMHQWSVLKKQNQQDCWSRFTKETDYSDKSTRLPVFHVFCLRQRIRWKVQNQQRVRPCLNSVRLPRPVSGTRLRIHSSKIISSVNGWAPLFSGSYHRSIYWGLFSVCVSTNVFIISQYTTCQFLLLLLFVVEYSIFSRVRR